MIVGLPQKLLTNLYLHYIPEKEFYSHFNELLGLIMWKVAPAPNTPVLFLLPL